MQAEPEEHAPGEVVLATDEIVAEEVAIGDVDANDPNVDTVDDAVASEPVQEELLDTGALQRNVEAVLFVASEALSIKTLSKLTGAEEADVTMALQRIDTEFAERGLVLREVAGGYRFASSPAARAAVEAYLLPPKTNLSPAALETLAIVAYNEPVTKAQVEEIRGVSADSVIATLLDRRFIAESGRRESPGRPMLYKTTTDFLEAFGLNSLGDLPAVDLDAMQSREVELPMTQALSETEDAAPEALITEDAVTEDGSPDDAVAQSTEAEASAPPPPDQEAEALSLA
jgi:segregation and condensation protein B